MSDPILTIEEALLFLNLDSITQVEATQLYYLIDMITAAILSYCGQDPRTDPDQDSSVLPLVAGRILMQLYPQIVNQTTGIESQSFADISVKFTPDVGIDKFSQQLLSRLRVMSIF